MREWYQFNNPIRLTDLHLCINDEETSSMGISNTMLVFLSVISTAFTAHVDDS